MPYLRHVKTAAQLLPQLSYLADWMEVSCDPTKWRYIAPHQDIRTERASRTNVCVVDYHDSKVSSSSSFHSIDSLRSWLRSAETSLAGVKARLLIVEDLSRDVVEALGSTFEIEPCFFRSHLCDYLWCNTRDRWYELPRLPSGNRRASHFSMLYARPWYFNDLSSFQEARFEAGDFNVLRRLARDKNRKRGLDDPNAIVAMIRSKTSLWIRPKTNQDDCVVGVLLVDPTIREGYSLWGGRRNHIQCPEFGSSVQQKDILPAGQSLLDEAVYAALHLPEDEVVNLTQGKDVKALGIPIFRILLAEWSSLLKYIGARLGQIDWELEKPEFRPSKGGLDESLQKLHFWRRHVPQYRAMLRESIDALFGKTATSNQSPLPADEDVGTKALLQDFQSILEQMESAEARIERLVAVATTSISIEESRLAINQSNKLAKLTWLATVFVPLSFLTSFFSMTSDVASLRKTYWVFFIIALPLTFAALIVVNFLNVQEHIKGVFSIQARGKKITASKISSA